MFDSLFRLQMKEEQLLDQLRMVKSRQRLVAQEQKDIADERKRLENQLAQTRNEMKKRYRNEMKKRCGVVWDVKEKEHGT